MTEHLFATVERKVHNFKAPQRKGEAGYLLATLDRTAPREKAVRLAVGEVYEVIEALNYSDQAKSRKESTEEAGDVAVTIFSLVKEFAPQLSYSIPPVLFGVNGYGRHEGHWDGVIQVIYDAHDNPDQAVPELLRRLWSIVLYNPYAMEGLLTLDKTIQKVLSNYPPEVFSDFDPTMNRLSTPDEVIPRYDHLVKAMRIIRNHVQRTLLPSDWKPHLFLITNWHQSSWALAELEKVIQTQKHDQSAYVRS